MGHDQFGHLFLAYTSPIQEGLVATRATATWRRVALAKVRNLIAAWRDRH